MNEFLTMDKMKTGPQSKDIREVSNAENDNKHLSEIPSSESIRNTDAFESLKDYCKERNAIDVCKYSLDNLEIVSGTSAIQNNDSDFVISGNQTKVQCNVEENIPNVGKPLCELGIVVNSDSEVRNNAENTLSLLQLKSSDASVELQNNYMNVGQLPTEESECNYIIKKEISEKATGSANVDLSDEDTVPLYLGETSNKESSANYDAVDSCDDVNVSDNDTVELVKEKEMEGPSEEVEPAKEEEMEWPSEEFHTYMLGKICRICAEMTVVFDGPKKGAPKVEMAKFVKKVWKVDISDEDSNQYPVNVCLQCERKIKRLYLKVSKKKKCEMFRTKPAEFAVHKDQDCAICLLKEKDNENGNLNAVNEEERSTPETNSHKSKIALEPKRNPARKRGWPGQELSRKSVGCQTEQEGLLDNTTGLEEHDYTQDETLDQYLVLPKKLSGRTPYHKQPLCSVNTKYIRQDRLKPLIAHIENFCQSHKENKVEVMFFLLMQALRDAGDRAREASLIDIWVKKPSEGTSLTDEECLAKRIMLKQTKDQYRKEYTYYKEKLQKPVLKPPFIIDRLEKTYFPEHLEYYMTEGESGPVFYQHEKLSHTSYFALPESHDSNSVVMGARWCYFDAVAKTLEELSHTLESYMLELNENSCIHVDLSDYCEEKKDMRYFNDKSEASDSNKRFQNKMITYLFCVRSLEAITDSTVTWTCSQDSSNCRPLMKALVTDAGALHPSMLMIEEERTKMIGKCFHITSQSGLPLRFIIFFSNAAPEVRKDYRNTTGLSMSSLKKIPPVINRYGNLCLELKRSWLASSPRLVDVGRVTNLRTKCGRCGEQGHNVRKCSKPSLENAEGSNVVVQHKKQKKHRTIPSNAYPTSTGNTSQASHGSQQHHLQQLPLQHQQEHQDPLPEIVPGSSNVNHNNSVICKDDQLLWTCSDIDGSSQVGGHISQSTQVLIPSTNSEYQAVPQRTLIQGSQGTSPPVYVWTYTVVQPQPGTVVHQQPIGQQLHQLSSLQPQPIQHGSSQQQPQHMTVIHQQSVQQSASQQTQQLSVIHQQVPQQTLSVAHQHDSRRPVQQQAVQEVNVIHQSGNSPQSVSTSQRLVMAHQQANAQQQSHQHLSLVHQQQVAQSNNIVQQVPQPQAQQCLLPETSSPQEQLPHSQSSDLQPMIGQW